MRRNDGAFHSSWFICLSSKSFFQWTAVGIKSIPGRSREIRKKNDSQGCFSNGPNLMGWLQPRLEVEECRDAIQRREDRSCK